MATIFYDSFTDTTGTSLSAHTPDTGTGWTEVYNDDAGNDLEIQTGNRMGPTSGNADGNIHTADATYSTADYTVHCIATDVGSGDDTTHLIARYQDISNMYGLRYSSNRLILAKKVSGTWTTLSDQSASAPVDNDKVELEVNGTTLRILVNDSEIASVTDSSISAAGKAAIGFGGGPEMPNGGDDMSALCDIDDFTVETLGATPVTFKPKVIFF